MGIRSALARILGSDEESEPDGLRNIDEFKVGMEEALKAGAFDIKCTHCGRHRARPVRRHIKKINKYRCRSCDKEFTGKPHPF